MSKATTRVPAIPAAASEPCAARCATCGQLLIYTSCSAPTCNGWMCTTCHTGCDIDDGDGSVCCDEIDALETDVLEDDVLEDDVLEDDVLEDDVLEDDVLEDDVLEGEDA